MTHFDRIVLLLYPALILSLALAVTWLFATRPLPC